jgi:tetratricopeptide (TPR) repeat protein/TolB-like protein/predicted Ser/Thr protein kinase
MPKSERLREEDDQRTIAEDAAVLTPGSGSGRPSVDGSSPSDAPTVIESSKAGSAFLPTDDRRSEPPETAAGTSGGTAPVLQPGSVLGQRYEILKLLGQGGMGAVYKARDREVGQLVALKVIRPDLASNNEIIARFKQELILARQVTHKNVVRIYDLAEVDGVKLITMEYVEGEDLRSVIHEKSKLPPEEVVEIMRQVCSALVAAHSVGVIHRDLKPQNIMRDKAGRVLVMDFGLARTLKGTGMTQTGHMVGTLEYMSPEQALGTTLDPRADIFTFGLIFYELLTGKRPFIADSPLASLIKRTRERAIPVSDQDRSISGTLSGIVSKCLERDPNLRYQNAAQILADLEGWQGKRAAASLTFLEIRRWVPGAWPWISLAVVLLILTVVGIRYRDKLFTRTPSQQAAVKPEVSLAILPFRNASGDASLDWLGPSLAEMLSTDVGQSAHLRTISPDRLHRVLTDLQITANVIIDPTMLHRIAEFSSADTVVWGQYAKFGDQIRIDATLQDLKHDRHIPLKIEVPSEKDVPGGVDRLADSIRQNLGMSRDVVKELQASSFQPTSKSLLALQDYNQGVQLLRDDKNLEAQRALEAATEEDPAFALAFSKLGQTYANLGYDTRAEQAAQKAVGLSEYLPQAEKYLIAAIYAQLARNYPEAINAYENLAKASPDKVDVQSALARLYEDTGDFAKADEYYQKILTANPKDIAAIVSTGRVAIKRGDAQASLDPLNRALSLSVQVGNDENSGMSLHLLGVAYRMLNKPEEALPNFQQALAIRQRTGEKRGIAYSLNEMAVVETLLGKAKDALGHFQGALQIRRDIGDKRGLADTLLDLGNFYDDRGNHDQALKMYQEALQLERYIGNEGLEAVCLNNIGAVHFEKSEYEDARTYYQQALQVQEKSHAPQDIVNAVHNLAETSVRMGQYEQAVKEYMRALELWRSVNDVRGAAMESYSLGTLFELQGRFGAALSSIEGAFKTFRDLKDHTFWMAEILGGYGEALALAGRGQEAQPYLDQALNLSRELKNDGMVAQTLDFQGDVLFYRGDFGSAQSYYERAAQTASHTSERDKVLVAKIGVAMAQVEQNHGSSAIGTLRSLGEQAETLGLKQMAVECSIYLGEAMMQTREYSHARQELERALQRADKLALKPLSTKAHYLLAKTLRSSGNQAEAQEHYRDALQLFDSMRKEAGGDKLLQRSDFKAIYDEAGRWSS